MSEWQRADVVRHAMTGHVHSRRPKCGDECRPVVVIDPEDAEQVERLADAVILEGRGYRIDKAIVTVGLTKGLREFAAPTPPKPDEPQGLGAVVESGPHRYVRMPEYWLSAYGVTFTWDDFDGPIRVLSEGVTP